MKKKQGPICMYYRVTIGDGTGTAHYRAPAESVHHLTAAFFVDMIFSEGGSFFMDTSQC